MWVRIASAAVGIPLAVLIVFGWGGALFAPVVGVLALIGLNEFYRGCRQLGAEPLDWIGRAALVLLIAYAGVYGNRQYAPLMSAALMLLLMISLLIEVIRPNRAPIRNLGATALGVLYVGWLFSIIVLLRFFFGYYVNPTGDSFSVAWLDLRSYGAWLTLFLLLTIWACDTGAYFTGRFLGKHKLAPSLSPGKTVEGFVGGLILASAISVLTGGWIGLSIAERVAIGLILGVCGVIGDLVESAMKREMGIKDFGAIMPGHGGVLDRFDSLLFAAPALFFFVALTV